MASVVNDTARRSLQSRTTSPRANRVCQECEPRAPTSKRSCIHVSAFKTPGEPWISRNALGRLPRSFPTQRKSHHSVHRCCPTTPAFSASPARRPPSTLRCSPRPLASPSASVSYAAVTTSDNARAESPPAEHRADHPHHGEQDEPLDEKHLRSNPHRHPMDGLRRLLTSRSRRPSIRPAQ